MDFTGFRFRRQIDVFPWLKFNLTKTGISATVGPEKVHVTVGRDGTYVYADLPGKGTYFRRKLGPLMDDLRDEDDDDGDDEEEEVEHAALIDRSLFDRLLTSDAENALVSALLALDEGNLDEAYRRAQAASGAADGAYLAGFLAIKHNDWQVAIRYFLRAVELADALGELFNKYEVDMRVFLPIAQEFAVAIRPNHRDCLLALAIAHERLDHKILAIDYLQDIRRQFDPDDLIVRLLLAELLDDVYEDHPHVQHEIVKLAEGIRNESPLHAALMYYRGRALRRLNVMHAARDTLTKALRRKKDYPSELLVALRYERALLYEDEGQDKRAHEEFEKIYALAPDLEDVAERLGLLPEITQPITRGPLKQRLPSEAADELEAVSEEAAFEIEDQDAKE